ncbi:MAG: isochorismatase family protein [Clostridia bacterium]|jgi:hypothetical protein
MHTLAIIDMQSEFEASKNKDLQPSILREINLCRRNNWPIILVEYFNSGNTCRFITNNLRNYNKLLYIIKYEDDGSMPIDRAVRTITRSKNLRVVGVNTDYCVKQTAVSLARDYGYKVNIVDDGCWTLYHTPPNNVDLYKTSNENMCHRVGIRDLKMVKNISVICKRKHM